MFDDGSLLDFMDFVRVLNRECVGFTKINYVVSTKPRKTTSTEWAFPTPEPATNENMKRNGIASRPASKPLNSDHKDLTNRGLVPGAHG